MKKKLEELIARKQKFIKEAREKVKSSSSVDEVRSLGDQIEEAQRDIDEARAMLAEAEEQRADDAQGGEGELEQGGEDDQEQSEESIRARNFRPGMESRSFDLTANTARETRAKNFAKSGRMSVDTEETRATLVSSGKIATPTKVSGINDTPNVQVSSIVDMVKIENCAGMGANKVAYEKSVPTAATKTEGAAATASDPEYGYVTIQPETIVVLSKVSKEVRKQSPLNYTDKVEQAALTALRKKAAAIITAKLTASALNEHITATAINEKTLRNIAMNYGGNEGINGGAVLFLNKKDLVAFGDVRGTNEKKAVYEITPDSSNPNTGVIKDGGLSVRYCINSNCKPLTGTTADASKATPTMFYGDPTCFELDLFSAYEIVISEDRYVDELMLGIVGDAQLGGDVVVDKGFVLVDLPKSGS